MASSPTRKRYGIRNGDEPRFCTSQKVCYIDYQDALNAAELNMERVGCPPGCHLTPYHCDRCRWWHIFTRRIVFRDEESMEVAPTGAQIPVTRGSARR